MSAQENLSPKQFNMTMADLRDVRADDYGVQADDARIPDMVRASDERHGFSKMDALKEDISQNGIKEPLTVLSTRPKSEYPNDTVRLVNGHHRLAAARELGMAEVPVKVHQPVAGKYPGTYKYPTWGGAK